ncbi:hypothetical protein MTO96_031946 [Rhipicephalus appendiculatus]
MVAQPSAINRSCHATSALAQVEEHIMRVRRDPNWGYCEERTQRWCVLGVTCAYKGLESVKKLKTETEEDERRAGGTEAATKQQKKRTNKERATTERAEEARGVKPRRQRKRCAARDDELLPAFLRRALDQGVPARSTSGGLSKVQRRGLLSGSCLGAVAGSRFVDEAYLVRSSWVVA